MDSKFTALVSTCPPNFYRIAAESIFTATGGCRREWNLVCSAASSYFRCASSFLCFLFNAFFHDGK